MKLSNYKQIYDFYYIPIIYSNHWSLAKVNIKRKKINFYDSLDSSVRHVFIYKTLKTFFNYILKEDYEWTLNIVEVPQQNNNYDCGIYMLIFLEKLINKEYIDIFAEDIPYYRLKFGIELIEGQIKY
jgi:sentrin-specific protease 1